MLRSEVTFESLSLSIYTCCTPKTTFTKSFKTFAWIKPPKNIKSHLEIRKYNKKIRP